MASQDDQLENSNLPSAPEEEEQVDEEPERPRPASGLQNCKTKFLRQIDAIGYKRRQQNTLQVFPELKEVINE